MFSVSNIPEFGFGKRELPGLRLIKTRAERSPDVPEVTRREWIRRALTSMDSNQLCTSACRVYIARG